MTPLENIDARLIDAAIAREKAIIALDIHKAFLFHAHITWLLDAKLSLSKQS